MKTNLTYLLSSLLLLCLCNNAYTSNISISGNISTNTTWAVDTVKIIGDITINNGVTLTIASGTNVVAQGYYNLTVNGRILAIGNQSDSIRFTSLNPTIGWEGIYFDNTSTANDSSIFQHCIFTNGNRGSNSMYLGGVLGISNFNKVRISNSRFSNNKSTTHPGGALCVNDGIATISNNIFSNNICTSHNGGAVFFSGTFGKFSGNTIAFNTGTSGGGLTLLACNGGEILENKIINNSANGYGGAMYISFSYGVKITNNLFANNSANNGGAIYCWQSVTEFINNTISNNYASSQGGGIYLNGNSDPVFKNCIIAGNTKTTSANPNEVHLDDNSSDPKFYFCDILGDKALFTGAGAGINYNGAYQDNINATPRFINQTSGKGAGFNALSANWSIDSLSSCINKGTPDTVGLAMSPFDLIGNQRIKNGIIDIGAFEFQGNIISPCIISQNTNWNADTIRVNCNVVVNDSISLTIAPGTFVQFTGPYSITVKGRLLAVGTKNQMISFSVTDTSNFSNATLDAGGWKGIVFESSALMTDTVKLVYCKLIYAKNKDRDGGALYIQNTPNFLISNCLISNNMSVQDGGAIYAENCNIVIRNSVICNNSADYGGAIYFYDANAQIINNLIVNNYASFCGGLYIMGSQVALKNNIVYFNRTLSWGAYCSQFALELSTICNFYNNNIEYGYNSITFSNKIGVWQNNITSNPEFLAPSLGAGVNYDGLSANWNLKSTSPCINAGLVPINISESGTADYNGNPRVVADTIDIGACEVQLHPRFISGPVSQSKCIGTTATFTLTTSLQANIRWFKNGQVIPQAITMNLTIPAVALSDAGYYYCELSNPFGILISDSARLIVFDTVAILMHPVTQTKCIGDSVSFSVNANGSAPLIYQWKNLNGNLSGGTGPNFTINSLVQNDAGNYYCVVSNMCTSVQSNGASLMLNTKAIVSSIIPISTICQGQNLVIPAYASGTSPLSYQWYKSGTIVPGQNTTSLNLSSIDTSQSGNYYCKASNICGLDSTNIVSVTVNSPPQITSQPTNLTKCAGQSALFSTVANSSLSASYQWYKGGNIISGANSNSLLISPVNTSDAGQYKCRVTNSCGFTETNDSLLTVNEPISIISQSSDSSRCEGKSMNFEVNASGSTPILYEWYKGVNPISGATLPTHSISSVTTADAGTYYCKITNVCGFVNSAPKILTVNLNPITNIGTNKTICMGSPLVLSPGIGYSCVWNTGWLNPQLSVDTSGSYFVTVTDANGCTGISNTVNITVKQPYNNEQICIVGVDSATGQNVVVWEKTPNQGTKHYKIYKESTISGIYNLIAIQPFDSLSAILDPTSQPAVKSARYKISCVDTCNNESALSAPHKTMVCREAEHRQRKQKFCML
ncbi:MAG: immunoglobulin domain-containing protein [Saprospiraceae bacterium]|nr:immunoglobulin domain-containing protein [Saprospiraceae bacterium]